MNLQIEIIKWKVGPDFEKFRHELKQFAETHKVVSVYLLLQFDHVMD